MGMRSQDSVRRGGLHPGLFSCVLSGNFKHSIRRRLGSPSLFSGQSGMERCAHPKPRKRQPRTLRLCLLMTPRPARRERTNRRSFDSLRSLLMTAFIRPMESALVPAVISTATRGTRVGLLRMTARGLSSKRSDYLLLGSISINC